jgi:DNA polymerase III delta prime subunit
MFTHKYEPRTTQELVGCEFAAKQALEWLKSWQSMKRSGAPQFRPALLITGPCGVGKTLLAKLICKQLAMKNAIFINSGSEPLDLAVGKGGKKNVGGAVERSNNNNNFEKSIKSLGSIFDTRRVDSYLTGRMMNSKPGVVVVDEVDILAGSNGRGVCTLANFVKQRHVPVVCVALDTNLRSLGPLKDLCLSVRVQKPPIDQLERRLLKIAATEKRPIGRMQASRIAASSGCDVRHALITLQYFLADVCVSVGAGGSKSAPLVPATADMDKLHTPFDYMPDLFRQRAPAERSLVNISIKAHESDPFMMPLMVQHNYLHAKKLGLDDMARASDMCSLGDVYEGRSRRHDPDLMACISVGAVASAVNSPLSKIEFPAHLARFRVAAGNRRDIRALAGNMGAPFTQVVTVDMPLMSRALLRSGDVDLGCRLVARYPKFGPDNWNTLVSLGDPVAGVPDSYRDGVLIRLKELKSPANNKKKKRQPSDGSTPAPARKKAKKEALNPLDSDEDFNAVNTNIF